jgi:beta-lactamase regulating signal transducer with metallopeptidase domain/thiol-disulfide isomerase/thioredoxin
MNPFTELLVTLETTGWLMPAVLFIKLTALLLLAWGVHGMLASANPRWRVVLWRAAAVGIVAVGCLIVCPPLMQWRVLPAHSEDVIPRVQPMEPTREIRSVVPEEVEPGDQFVAEVLPAPGNFAALPASVDPSVVRSDSSPRETSQDAVTTRRSPSLVGEQSGILPSLVRSSWAWGAIWSLVVVGLTVRTAWGLHRLRGMLRSAAVVPESVQSQAVALARRLGYAGPVQVRQSSEVAAPCLAGLLPPVILLPVAHSETSDGDELNAILTHEIAHLQRHDVWWNVVWHALGILLWFHPLAWRVRRVHADACDGVADAVAADCVGSADAYGRTLARIAVRMHQPAPVAALAMARSSHVRRRIESLQRRVFRDALPRRQTLLVVAAALLVSVAVGGGALARLQDSSRTPEFPAAKSTAPAETLLAQADAKPSAIPAAETLAEHHILTVSTVADATGEPLEGVKIRFNGRVAGKRFDQRLETNDDGIASVYWARGATVNNLWMQCERNGYVPIHYNWQSDVRPIEMPERLDLQFAAGQTVGGVVQDENGAPIAGAHVEITMPLTWPELDNWVFNAAELTTDDAGRWTWPSAPPDFGTLGVRLKHPDFMDGYGTASADGKAIAVLKRGLEVAGRVVDTEGKPIAGATARLGFDRFGSNDPESKTDADGRFVLKNCKPGKSLVTIQAEGLSPQFKDVFVEERADVGEFRLEPGHMLRLRVVDQEGQPVKGVWCGTDTWRSYRTLEFRADTDADGRIIWTSAPRDAVLCDFGKDGYMAVRKVSLEAGEKEHIITIPRRLTVTGTVTDAATKEPLPEFGIRHGYLWAGRNEPSLSGDAPVPYVDGTFGYSFDEPIIGAYVLQAVAPGYLPAISRPIRSDERDVSVEFTLQRGEGLAGRVVGPDGQPVAKATVGLGSPSAYAFLKLGYFDRGQGQAPIVETDADGKFAFPPQESSGSYAVIALHDAGYAELTRAEFEKSPELRLIPWGRVEGRVLRGTQPDANCEVSLWPKGRMNGEIHRTVFSFGYTLRTDEHGAFSFDRVIPGAATVSRVVITEFGRSSQHAPGWTQQIDVRSNETTAVTIGGTGQPVIGRVELDRQPELPVDWTSNEPATIDKWDVAKDERTGDFRCIGNIDRHGRFDIPDVPPGDYRLSIPVNNPPVPNSCGAGSAIGMATYNFTVPELPGGRSDEPLDLGVIEAQLYDTLDSGELAPDFVAERLNGGQIRLSEYQGKLVVLDFWASWCAPCVGELPGLAELYDEFKANDRFRLVSVSCDNEISSPRDLLAGKGYDWDQAFVAGMYAAAVKDYTVRSLPGLFLIGPDGRVMSKNIRGADLRNAVAAALANDELFKSAATAERPPRFPVTHFETDPAAELAESPAVVVVDDSDPVFKGDRHTDALRLLSDDGRELKIAREFNNCQTVGGMHAVAVDQQRGRFFCSESVGKRVHCFDRHGRRLWQVERIDADALAVDPVTGNVWCSGGRLDEGATVVLDERGREVAAFPLRAVDLQFDPHSDCFWMVGYRILKVNREGNVLFEKPVEGWCSPSLAVHPANGSVWFIERDHPDVSNSRDRLWKLNSDGTEAVMRDLDKQNPFAVECDPESGVVWVATWTGGLQKFQADGTPAGKVDVKAANLAWGRGALWAFTETAVLKLDAAGSTVLSVPIDPPSQQGWLAVFDTPTE